MGKACKEKLQSQSINACYHQLEDIGEGGNAVVLRVQDISSGEYLALKKLKTRGNEKEFRFLDEITVMIENKDIPGIIPIIEYSKEFLWYTMPLAEPLMIWSEKIFASCKLNEYRSEKFDITPWLKAVGKAFIELSKTLIELHNKGIHHRDIKPDNIYILNGRACLGDFGLVEFPENANDFTRSDKGLGAIFTIAPEMKRNPKKADGAKADVYSLAKTLWMVLSGDIKGFDGQYSSTDKSHGLRYFSRLKHEYLVEIEQLLADATSNIPAERPDIKSFMTSINKWCMIYEDRNISEANEWEFISTRIWGKDRPTRMVFDTPNAIVNLLNVLSESAALNHMLFPNGGGLDFSHAELSGEKGFIAIQADNCIAILKPKALYYESFPDARWNYFFLEADDVEPIKELEVTEEGEQYIVEDFPGHYVNAIDAVYGVYDYDSGKPLPSGARIVSRFCRGKFLIVIKTATYNYIPNTYDGRHNVMNNDELRSYFANLQHIIQYLKSKGIKEETALSNHKLGYHPYPERVPEKYHKLENKTSDSALPDPEKYIRINYNKWNFLDLLPSKNGIGKIAYHFEFELESFKSPLTYYPTWYLAEDGMIHKMTDDCPRTYEVFDRNKAIQLKTNLNQRVKDLCQGYDLSNLKWDHNFNIIIRKNGSPTHLFSKAEIENLLRNADDRIDNQLVIDEEGYPHIITSLNKISGSLFPVSHEIWHSRHNYVGKYANVNSLIDSTYINSLYCWLIYLKTGRSQYCDENHYNDEISLLNEIKKYYT